MRIRISLLIKNSLLIDFVDADFPWGMDDFVLWEKDAYMGDIARLIIEECEVAGRGFVKWF